MHPTRPRLRTRRGGGNDQADPAALLAMPHHSAHCFRANINAAALYKSLGFVVSGELEPLFKEPNYRLRGADLDAFRS